MNRQKSTGPAIWGSDEHGLPLTCHRHHLESEMAVGHAWWGALIGLLVNRETGWCSDRIPTLTRATWQTNAAHKNATFALITKRWERPIQVAAAFSWKCVFRWSTPQVLCFCISSSLEIPVARLCTFVWSMSQTSITFRVAIMCSSVLVNTARQKTGQI